MSDIDWSGELRTDLGAPARRIAEINETDGFDHVVVVEYDSGQCRAYCVDSTGQSECGNVRIVNAPKPAPLPPERWVVEVRRPDGSGYHTTHRSQERAVEVAGKIAHSGGHTREVWFGPLRQFRVDDSPIDGQGPGEDEGWTSLKS